MSTIYHSAFTYLKRLMQFYMECNQASINLEILPVEGLWASEKKKKKVVSFLSLKDFLSNT